MIEFEIKPPRNRRSAEEVTGRLADEKDAWKQAGIDLQMRDPGERSGIETAVIVAAVGAASSALTAFVTGLLRMWEKDKELKGVRKIVLESKEGRIEVPADTPQKKIDEHVATLERMNSGRVFVSLR